MRLHQIRISGFKSFVDYTVLAFPSNRVGVVGPNGCGKSNVIDAVRWVMGEKSAKNLRGSSMADVIFNGSNKRKPGEYAEVELVFSEANLRQYPDETEIAIKRRLTRDGQSHYFLNDVRCRRKDITAIFMGTGLGPRSYAIIEQGMISRFIEAKPQELRVYMEEAAGISMYKERRRETELHLGHTRENMERLDDVRNELGRQLERLKRQARAAENYKKLKEAEELLKGQLLAMRWRKHSLEIERQQEIIATQEAVLETQSARQAALEEGYAQVREEQAAAQARFSQMQEQFYSHQSDLKQIEQTISHRRERQEQLQLDFEESLRTAEQIRHHLEADREQLVTLERESELALAQLEELEEQLGENQAGLQASSEQAEQAQQAWEAFNQQLSGPAQRIEVERTKLESLQQRLEQTRLRRQRLDEENQELDLQGLESRLSALELEINETELALAQLRESVAEEQEALVAQRDENQHLSVKIHGFQEKIQQHSGRLSSLEALQEAALGKGDTDLLEWLEERGFPAELPRLAQLVTVEQGWERALETVLGHYLEALCIQDLNHLARQMDSLPQCRLSVVDQQSGAEQAQTSVDSVDGVPLLADKVRAEWPVGGLLAGIYAAENLTVAEALRAKLAPHESVITPQGWWLGANWLTLNEEIDQRAGVFAREQDIQRLNTELEDARLEVEDCGKALEDGESQLRRHEMNRDQLQQQANRTQEALSQLKAQQGGQHARLEELSLRAKRLLAEHAELSGQIREDEEQVVEINEYLLEAQTELAELQEQREQLERRKQEAQAGLEQTRQQWQGANESRHRISGHLQAMHADKARLQQAVARLQEQLEQVREKQEDLNTSLANQKPITEWEQQYEEKHAVVQELEAQVQQARQQLEEYAEKLRAMEEEERSLENLLNQSRTLLEETRLTCQANQVRRQTVEEQLAEHEQDVENLLEGLPPEATEEAWQEGIEAVEKKILKLGSINLAALEELEEQQQRKDYLDKQVGDLEQAMRVLEQAIAAIDNETRERFKKTLDQVNDNFRKMFPRLFGGGEAYLQLNGDDMLSAGISIMARPLGKRNSSIHLLSGGEKALTAVALVFSIFELNPAPFCLLDEVDAPLDDTNVVRFCELVKSMSENVQIIFISHNKIAMEIADQLIGVTMQEPGVSRPVSVDMDLAVAMTA